MYPKEHAEVIVAAKAATEDGNMHDTKWWLFEDKVKTVDEIDPRRQHMSDAVGKTIFDLAHPERASLCLAFYNELWKKLCHFGDDKVLVRIKGGNAAAIQVGMAIGPERASAAGFNFSDLDIDVMINPLLPSAKFEEIKGIVHMVLRQALSTHKRRLDRSFFRPREGDPESTMFFKSDITKELFKVSLTSNIEKLEHAKCCMSDIATRNKSSNISYLITSSNHDSAVEENTKRRVKIEQPHLYKSEKIPLGFTPFYVTVNDTVHGTRKNGDKVDFTLFRMKMSHIIDLQDQVKVQIRLPQASSTCSSPCGTADEDLISVFSDTSSTDKLVTLKINTEPYDKVSADFIDVWVGNQNDHELNEFAARGGFQGKCTTTVPAFGFYLILPTLNECKLDYFKLLYVFDCPDSKREKRQRKYAALCAIGR